MFVFSKIEKFREGEDISCSCESGKISSVVYMATEEFYFIGCHCGKFYYVSTGGAYTVGLRKA